MACTDGYLFSVCSYYDNNVKVGKGTNNSWRSRTKTKKYNYTQLEQADRDPC